MIPEVPIFQNDFMIVSADTILKNLNNKQSFIPSEKSELVKRISSDPETLEVSLGG